MCNCAFKLILLILVTKSFDVVRSLFLIETYKFLIETYKILRPKAMKKMHNIIEFKQKLWQQMF